MKKLLILGGASTHVKVVKQAKQMGIYTIVTDYLSVVDSPAKLEADECWDIDINDVGTLVKACRKNHVDGILNYCIDPAQLPYQRLCEKLSLPFLQAFWCNEELYVYDPGLRFPGSDYDLTMIRENGFNPIKAVIDFALTGEMAGGYGNPAMACCYKDKICLILSVISRPGVIARIQGLESLSHDTRILSIDKRCKCGMEIPASGDIRQRIFEMLVYLPKEEVNDFLTEFYQILHVLDKNNENMIIDRIGKEVVLDKDGIGSV